jgi:MFS family permease
MKAPASDSAEISTARPSILPTIGGKYFALAILFAMNLLNYVDRYSFFAAGSHIQKDLKIDDYWFGWLGAAFMIVYTIISPPMGWLGDRYNRKLLLASGVGLWSLATVGTAFSSNYSHMFFWRALLGVGEASYGVIAPALISDLFTVKERGRAMGIYYLALPVGTALGYMLGGTIADRWGWPAVFFVVGLPGLLAAAAGLVMSDPGRGASEAGGAVGRSSRPALRDYLDMFKTPTFLYNTAGMAAVTFATGAVAAWGSTFYQRVHGLSATDAGQWIGVLLVGAGVIGILLGMFLPDLLLKVTKKAYLVLAALAVLGALPLGAVGILDPSYRSSLGFLFGASILLSMVLGPCNTVTSYVVPANRRAAGYALFIFLIHLFGDISSPIILGWISTIFGKPTVADSSLGRFFTAIGAAPVDDTNLTVALLSVVPVLALGCVLFLLGARHLEKDQAKAGTLPGLEKGHLAQFHH